MFPISTKTELSSGQSPTSPEHESVLLPSVTMPVRVQPVASRRASNELTGGSQDEGGTVKSEPYSGRQCFFAAFNGMFYLGRCLVDQPTSQTECEDAMSQLVGAEPLAAEVVMPNEHSRAIHIVDDKTGEDLAYFPIRTVVSLVCATQPNLVNFVGMCVTERHSSMNSSSILLPGPVVHYCHVLQVQDHSQVLQLVDAMDAVLWKQSSEIPLRVPGMSHDLPELSSCHRPIEVAFDIREPSDSGPMVSVPRSCCGGVFSFQKGVQKEIQVLVYQPASVPPLVPHRCVGVAIAAGCNVGQSAMNLLGPGEVEQLDKTWHKFLVRVRWQPADERDAELNEISKDDPVCLSIAADIEFVEVQDPLRFMREINVEVCEQRGKLVRSIVMSPMFDLHYVTLKESLSDSASLSDDEPVHYTVFKIEMFINHRAGTSPPPVPGRRLTLTVGSMAAVAVAVPTTGGGDGDGADQLVAPTAADPDTTSPALQRLFTGTRTASGGAGAHDQADGASQCADEEVLLSGAGVSDRSWSNSERNEWDVILDRMDTEFFSVSKEMKALVLKRGVPEGLRGIVWQVLSGCRGENDNSYFQRLQEEESTDEAVIRNDLHRTFTGHTFFSKQSGPGQAAIYAVSKAYSNHDKAVGYCQGLSYIIAGLVLHMSTECAFRVLVCIMFKFHLRDLFAVGLSGLKLRTYQLKKLVEDQLPDLHAHFCRQDINVAMFSTQWFLSLYTSSFGLYTSIRFLDLFLVEGIDSVFQMAMALLKLNRKALLQLEFDGILDYFRHLPKSYLSVDHVLALFEVVISTKISSRKLSKYKKEYALETLAETYEQRQMEKLQAANEKLQSSVRTLTKETETLAAELVKSKITMRAEMDELERRLDIMSKQYRQAVQTKQSYEAQLKAVSASTSDASVPQSWSSLHGVSSIDSISSYEPSPPPLSEASGGSRTIDADSRLSTGT